MCLAVVAIGLHPRHALVIAANRDELHARPAAAAHAWPDGVFAGRDEEAGGTWLGVDRRGRFAFVTNFREPGRHDPQARSRGELPLAILRDRDDVAAACARVARDGDRYNGFNVVAGERESALSFSNRGDRGIVALGRGVHGISNGALDARWPKIVRLERAVAAWCEAGDDDREPLWRALADRQPAADDELPATGLTRERERLVSAPFIVDPVYGTRASTLVTVSRDGVVTFAERRFDPRAIAIGEVSERFAIGAPR
jgi:uncharacterized protein with NRDE domain